MAISPGTPLTAGAMNLAFMGIGGIQLVSFTNQSSHTVVIPFGMTFPSPPLMPSPNIASGSGTATRWFARAINVGTTQFTLFLFPAASGTSTTWENIPVHWEARHHG